MPSRWSTCPILATALLAGGCDRQAPAPAQPGAAQPAAGLLDTSHRGTALPALSLSDDAGHALALPSLAGRPLLVNLWATWCGPCVKELPTLDALSARPGAPRVIAVSQDSAGADVAGFFAAHHIVHLTAWRDPDGKLAAAYGVGNLPTTILYAADGRELWRYTGTQDWTSAGAAVLLARR